MTRPNSLSRSRRTTTSLIIGIRLSYGRPAAEHTYDSVSGRFAAEFLLRPFFLPFFLPSFQSKEEGGGRTVGVEA
jgi:hypothetical protein